MWIPENEYNEIKKKFPIPCVDLVITNNENKILLFKRKNEPAKGQWWFPGGRVNFGEKLEDAALRKLKEECGIEERKVSIIGPFDIFLNYRENNVNVLSHGISVFFNVSVDNDYVRTDDQTEDHMWCEKDKCLDNIQDPALKSIAGKVIL